MQMLDTQPGPADAGFGYTPPPQYPPPAPPEEVRELLAQHPEALEGSADAI
ncbi:hypothetical protein N5D37_12975 [Comamonas aquatica]|uniref:hypothetical protein n=1 Tax=Comamonas aquatica TaxID=225991 RepID=UPI002449604F|nr:hypothetical protein [Comamonas aquatica]MDH1766539.1 hypothetical protein [Comamonas aquatica]